MTFDWDHLHIYPPIGIARVGNSTDGWFYGPEVPGHFEEPEGGFKDANGAVKRQAARFRVYAFDKAGKVLGEVNKSSGYDIQWQIQVVNKKASWYTFMGKTQEGAFQPGYTTLRNPTVQPDLAPDLRDRLIVDSGIKRINTGGAPVPLAGKFYGSKDTPSDIYLGEARTDEEGRLVVLAGHGTSKSILDPDNPYPYIMTDFDSADWIDDTCDGWISVTIYWDNKAQSYHLSESNARVIGTTPKFANSIYAPTSLYDLMEDVYERPKREAAEKNHTVYDVGEVDWHKHIWPLLQRPPLLSWVNGQANGGHGKDAKQTHLKARLGGSHDDVVGPNGPGNFFEEGWQDSLSDPSPASEPIRRGVLGRMRLPVTNSKYDQARTGQAYSYFMPWLSGDGGVSSPITRYLCGTNVRFYAGRTTAGDPSTFASVTELQYDRLMKWANGQFTKKPTKEYIRFADIPLDEQPKALIRASLEATIGAPLYPGIEMSWNAELTETYNLKADLSTISMKVKPGDLTKFLSLPWQSDFYMCRSYWWPSARPDTIVTEEVYDTVAQSVVPAQIAKRLTDRVPWERGLHQNYTDEYGDQPLFANTDMAKNWHKLGFIVERPSSGPLPIFVEVQRSPIHRPKKVVSATPRSGKEKHGPLVLPTPDSGECPIQSIESLREHLQTAMAIELATIPLYLFGMYSIKTPAQYARDPRYYDPIIAAIRGVVAEEMLHLSLAGNVLRAVGGTPKLYDVRYIPSYPMIMPGRVPKLWLQLRKATKANLQTYVDVETREKPNAKPESGKYETLGQFYDAIKFGLKYLTDKGENIFDPKTIPFQFAPGLGYQSHNRDTGGSVVVTNLDTANLAVDTIIIQGEGSPGPYDDPDKLEKDHYDVFLDLKDGDDSWDLYPVLENPVTSDYWNLNKQIYQVSMAFDASYCFLLRTIETLWYVEKESARQKLVLANMYSIMMGVLAPLARFLVTQPVGPNGKNAAPCFGYYEFKEGVSELKQVQDEMQAVIDSYLSVTRETADQVAVNDLGGMLEALLPIQVTINSLVDLKTFEKRSFGPNKKPVLAGVQIQGSKGFATGQ